MWIMMDVESDGPIPGEYSMILFGAVVIKPQLKETFLSRLCPISNKWIPEALSVSGYTREETLTFPHAEHEMKRFLAWVNYYRAFYGSQPMFISDNNGYDWQFINWYLWKFCETNPFGHSSTNLGSLYKGLIKDTRKNFKKLRKTRHDHNPVNDAIGNAEALLHMKDKMGLSISLD